MSSHLQDQVHARSIKDPTSFWAHQATHLHWHKPPTETLHTSTKTLADGTSYPSWTWFPGGEISTCFNCVDRHVLSGNGNSPAIFYDSPVTGTKRTYTYQYLLDEVSTLAAVLRAQGVRKGDVVMLYMPMIPEALIAMLAVNRLGAVHTVVFGGFAANALAQRMDGCEPVLVMTASFGIDGSKPPEPYQPLVRKAIVASNHKPKGIMVFQRSSTTAHWAISPSHNELDWNLLVQRARTAGAKLKDCVPVASNDAVYIIHTSGTTGTPKGVVRPAAGHAVGLHLSISYLFDIRGPGCVMFAASDIGWVVGHSYILYAPLLTGAATVLYEGKPVGTPDAGAFWRIVAEYNVRSLFTAPTALRAISRADPEHTLLKNIDGSTPNGIKSLKSLFLAGERSEPALVEKYQDLLSSYAAPGAHMVDNWWSTEVGSPITGRALGARTGVDRGAAREERILPVEMRAGSAGKPMPGFDVRVVDEGGEEVGRGQVGSIVLGLPLGPTSFTTLWRDEERFWRSYLKRFRGRWLDTCDEGFIDKEGYVHVMSRGDDVLNVSAHRLSSGAIEQAITSHPSVLEAYVTSIPDPLKGQLPFAFLILKPETPTIEGPFIPQALFKEINDRVRAEVGAIASLGGAIHASGVVPKTRSGKTLRRVMRSVLELGSRGEWEGEVAVPSTVEDAGIVEGLRGVVKRYFEERGGRAKL